MYIELENYLFILDNVLDKFLFQIECTIPCLTQNLIIFFFRFYPNLIGFEKFSIHLNRFVLVFIGFRLNCYSYTYFYLHYQAENMFI